MTSRPARSKPSAARPRIGQQAVDELQRVRGVEPRERDPATVGRAAFDAEARGQAAVAAQRQHQPGDAERGGERDLEGLVAHERVVDEPVGREVAVHGRSGVAGRAAIAPGGIDEPPAGGEGRRRQRRHRRDAVDLVRRALEPRRRAVEAHLAHDAPGGHGRGELVVEVEVRRAHPPPEAVRVDGAHLVAQLGGEAAAVVHDRRVDARALQHLQAALGRELRRVAAQLVREQRGIAAVALHERAPVVGREVHLERLLADDVLAADREVDEAAHGRAGEPTVDGRHVASDGQVDRAQDEREVLERDHEGEQHGERRRARAGEVDAPSGQQRDEQHGDEPQPLRDAHELEAGDVGVQQAVGPGAERVVEHGDVAPERERDEQQGQRRRGGHPEADGEQRVRRRRAAPRGPRAERERRQGECDEADEVGPLLLHPHLAPDRSVQQVRGRRREVVLQVDAARQLAHVPGRPRAPQVGPGDRQEERPGHRTRRGQPGQPAQRLARPRDEGQGEADAEGERRVEEEVVRREALRERQRRGGPGVPRAAGAQVAHELEQRERQERVEDDVQPRGLVDLVRVEPVEGPRGPGAGERRSEREGQPPRRVRAEHAGERHRQVVGEHRVARRPDHRRDEERRQQPMVGQGQRVRSPGGGCSRGRGGRDRSRTGGRSRRRGTRSRPGPRRTRRCRAGRATAGGSSGPRAARTTRPRAQSSSRPSTSGGR